MKILHVIGNLEIGGAELMLKRLVESHHGNLDYQHTVISLSAIGQVGLKLQATGTEVIALNMRCTLDVPLALSRLTQVVRHSRPDIVQTWMYHADLLGGLAARMAGNRHVIWGIRTTDIRASSSLATMIVRWLCARLSLWTPQVIVCAAEASRLSHIAVGYAASKMMVVPNGYNFSWLKASLDERQTLRKKCGFNLDDVVLGSLGRFHPVKDQQNFVLAAGLLAKKFPLLKFLMVGRGLDWDNAQLVNWIDSTGYRERFVLLGERKDVPQCFSAMDIFCLHSRTEGFPNVLAEAMAMGLPCVATDVGDAAILLADTGVMVPKHDSAGLVQGVMQLLMLSQDERHVLGIRAKASVEGRYSMTIARENFEEVYRKILSGSTN